MAGTRTPSQAGPTKTRADRVRPIAKDAAAMGTDLENHETPAVGRVLRHAREHRGLSLREVERITGRSNAYLSQVERGVIKKPDPLVLLELSDLYRLDFEALAEWAGLAAKAGVSGAEIGIEAAYSDQTFKRLLRLVKQLDARQRAQALAIVEDLLRAPQSDTSGSELARAVVDTR